MEMGETSSWICTNEGVVRRGEEGKKGRSGGVCGVELSTLDDAYELTRFEDTCYEYQQQKEKDYT